MCTCVYSTGANQDGLKVGILCISLYMTINLILIFLNPSSLWDPFSIFMRKKEIKIYYHLNLILLGLGSFSVKTIQDKIFNYFILYPAYQQPTSGPSQHPATVLTHQLPATGPACQQPARASAHQLPIAGSATGPTGPDSPSTASKWRDMTVKEMAKLNCVCPKKPCSTVSVIKMQPGPTQMAVTHT